MVCVAAKRLHLSLFDQWVMLSSNFEEESETVQADSRLYSYVNKVQWRHLEMSEIMKVEVLRRLKMNSTIHECRINRNIQRCGCVRVVLPKNKIYVRTCWKLLRVQGWESKC